MTPGVARHSWVADATYAARGLSGLASIRPCSTAAREWLTANCPDISSWQLKDGVLYLDARFLMGLLQGMVEDGLEVRS